MPKLHLIVHSTAVTKSCSTINSWVENCHSLPDSDDSSCCDHDTPSKTACKSNIRDSEDNSVHHEYTIRKYAEDEDREGDALFHKSNNPELSNMKWEFSEVVNHSMEKFGHENIPNSIIMDDYLKEIARFMLYLETTNDKKRINIIKS